MISPAQSRRALAAAAAASMSLSPAAGAQPPPGPADLRPLLDGAGRLVEPLLDQPQLEIQIRYLRVDRPEDASAPPRLTSFEFNVDPERYFYPASTVKLPVALAALEKLAALGVPGLGRDTPMLTRKGAPWQEAAEHDPDGPGGRPTVGLHVRRIFLVSDNGAYNRLYEFVGPDDLAASLGAKGYTGVRIFHRLAVRREPWHGRHTNPIEFLGPGGETVHRQPAQLSTTERAAPRPIPKGAAYYDADGELVEAPKDFAGLNALPLAAQQDMLAALVFPEAVPPSRRWQLAPGDREFVLRAMGEAPAASRVPRYDPARYHAAYAKFLVLGGRAETAAPPGLLIFNKSGEAFGYLVDNAYIADPGRGIEFFLAAAIHTNANQTYNDDRYEYRTVGLPFLRELGKHIYRLEMKRERANTPDLGHLRELVR